MDRKANETATLRSQLNQIAAASQMLEASAVGERSRTYLAVINQGICRLAADQEAAGQFEEAIQTLNQIENGGASYRRQAGNFRGFTVGASPFASLCLCYLCNLFCCGGRFFFCC